MRKVAILAAALLLAPSISQAKTLEDLLVEKGVITKGEASAAVIGGPSRVYWNDGTRLEFPDTGFTAQINTLIQTRYEFTDFDSDTGRGNQSSFEFERVRLAVSGTALNNEFTYMLQADFIGQEGGDNISSLADQDGGASTELLDAYIQWNACDWGSIRMGQFKTMVSRQFNTSAAKLQFADRSEVSDYFTLGRQHGLAGEFDLADGKIRLGAGIFNGISEGEGLNVGGVDTKHTGVASVRWNAAGHIDSFEEGDVNWSENFVASIGAAFAYSQYEDLAGLVEGDRYVVNVDGNVKVRGISFHTEFFYGNDDVDGAADEVEALGFYAQAGYFLVPKKWEIAARYGYLDCDNGNASGACAGNDNINEVTAGINYYFWKHNLKAQLNYAFVNEDVAGAGGDDINTNRWLFQLSSYF